MTCHYGIALGFSLRHDRPFQMLAKHGRFVVGRSRLSPRGGEIAAFLENVESWVRNSRNGLLPTNSTSFPLHSKGLETLMANTGWAWRTSTG